MRVENRFAFAALGIRDWRLQNSASLASCRIIQRALMAFSCDYCKRRKRKREISTPGRVWKQMIKGAAEDERCNYIS